MSYVEYLNYTFFDLKQNHILHKYIDSFGVKKHEIINKFPIELFTKNTLPYKKTYISLYNEELNIVNFDNIKTAYNYIKTHNDVYGQTNIAYQYISQKYPNEDIKFDKSKIDILALDIETAYDDSGFPNPIDVSQPITSICCKLINKKNSSYIIFGLKDCIEKDFLYIRCKNEIELLIKFQEYWKKCNPDIITGWNIELFDIPYIMNRSLKLLGENFTNQFSVFSNYKIFDNKCITSKFVGEKKDKLIFDILGITIYDYMLLYKKYTTNRLENNTLDTVAKHELNISKIDYHNEYRGLMDLYNRNPQLYFEYNKRDVEIIEKLERKINYIFFSITQAYLGKIRFSDIDGQMKFWDNLIYNYLKNKNIQIPPNKDETAKEIVGGYVKQPIAGLYKWIITEDLTSLYPSIMMTFNLSPETIVTNARCTINDIDDHIYMNEKGRKLSQEAINNNRCLLANGSEYSKEKVGIFPELIFKMFNERKKYKNKSQNILRLLNENLTYNELKEKVITIIDDDSIEINTIDDIKNCQTIFDSKQYAYKIKLNSLYGVLASRYFRYYNTNIAEAITMTGQVIIRYISMKLNDFLNIFFKTENKDYIIFNDTDSMGFNVEKLVIHYFNNKNNVEKVTIVSFLDFFIKKYIDPFIKNEFEILTKYFNAYTNMISMKREAIADRGLFRAKKNYILQLYDNEGIQYNPPKLKMMGIETAKSSTPPIVREYLEKAIKILLNDTEDHLHSFVDDFMKIFNNAPIKDISFPRGVTNITKWIDNNNNPKKGTPIHVKGCIQYNNLLKKYNLTSTEPLIKNGDKIKFIYLKKRNPIQSNVIAFFDNLPKEFKLERYIDKQMQYEKTFLEPLKSLTDIIKWNTTKTISINSFLQ